MQDNTVIKVENLAKKYVIRHQRLPYYTLRDTVSNFIKKPLAHLKSSASPSQEPFWALRDINFEVKRGEVLGIIGRNGAGKSTILKILSRITPPTQGTVRLGGRVASLLEVGTGFNPELTGRENIFLNGAILGMTRKEIIRKFDEIVEFSGVEKFIDTPVKRYSSGMYVRLAFAVAAHLEPEILIVDEVLAVGDLEFQKKCLGKMEEVTRESGRTIIFVSHNIDAVRRLCQKCILLENGEIRRYGEAEEVTTEYLDLGIEASNQITNELVFEVDPEKSVQVMRAAIKNREGNIISEVDTARSFFLEVDFAARQKGSYLAWFRISSREFGKPIVDSTIYDGEKNAQRLDEGFYNCRIEIDPFLTEGEYFFTIAIGEEMGDKSDRIVDLLPFRVVNYSGKPYNSLVEKCSNTIILKKFQWNVSYRQA